MFVLVLYTSLSLGITAAEQHEHMIHYVVERQTQVCHTPWYGVLKAQYYVQQTLPVLVQWTLHYKHMHVYVYIGHKQ